MRVALAASVALSIAASGAGAVPHQQMPLYDSFNGLRPDVYDDSLSSKVSHTAWDAVSGWLGFNHAVGDLKLTPGTKLLANGFPTADIDAVSAPRFVIYGDQDVAGQSYGAPPFHELQGYDVYNFAFWTVKWGPADNAAKFAAKSAADRKWFKSRYAGAGMKLMVSLFGADDKPQSAGRDPTQLGKEIADWVKKMGLDGVDVDYEEFDLFEQGKSAKWIIDLTKSLRANLPRPDYIITHAPIAPWFNADQYPKGYTYIDQQVGKDVDFYNVQFYNQGTFETCDSLLWDSGKDFPKTSIFEIAKYSKIPLDKLVIGKPGVREDADDGFMKPSQEGACLKTAVENGWKAGVMFWEYPHATASRLKIITDAAGLK